MSEITHAFINDAEGDDGYILIDAKDAHELLDEHARLTAALSEARARETMLVSDLEHERATLLKMRDDRDFWRRVGLERADACAKWEEKWDAHLATTPPPADPMRQPHGSMTAAEGEALGAAVPGVREADQPMVQCPECGWFCEMAYPDNNDCCPECCHELPKQPTHLLVPIAALPTTPPTGSGEMEGEGE